MFHSQILGPWSFVKFYNSLPANCVSNCCFDNFSTHKIYVAMHGKISELHFDVLLFSNPGEKVWKLRTTMGHVCPTVFLHFMTFSPRLETNDALQYSSDSFSRRVKYIWCVESCQNYISIHSCLPIPGDCSIMWDNFMDPGSERATYVFHKVIPVAL